MRRPDIDEKPYKEFLDGRVEVKRSPQPKHGKRPGATPERLPADGVLTGEPVLPGFRLPVEEVFGWLVRARPQNPEGA